MEINPASWHARWFSWACRSLDHAAPWGAHREYRFEHRTDLCTYFRTIGLGTLAAAYSVAGWLAFPLVLAVLPVYLFGIWSTLAGVGIVLATLLAAGLLVWIITEGFPRAARQARAGITQAVMVARDGTPTAVGLVVERVRAAAGRYCPTITFRRSNGNAD